MSESMPTIEPERAERIEQGAKSKAKKIKPKKASSSFSGRLLQRDPLLFALSLWPSVFYPVPYAPCDLL